MNSGPYSGVPDMHAVAPPSPLIRHLSHRRASLDQVRAHPLQHYSIRTDQAYVMWIRRFIRFHNLRHPRDMGPPDIERFLSHLANDRDV